jgi:hypothetical protein
MRMGSLLAVIGAFSLSTAPAFAAPAERVAAPVEAQSDLGGGMSPALIIGIIALGLAIFLAVDGGSDDPDSP